MNRPFKSFALLMVSLIFLISFQSSFAASLETGDLITFGKSYDEPILWRVIHIDERGHALLFSERILKFLPYNAVESTSDWEKSTARSWLNAAVEGGFLDPSQFTEAEINAIVPTKIKSIAHESFEGKTIYPGELFNPLYDENGNRISEYTYLIDNYLSDSSYAHFETEDKVFLLSIGELKNYVIGNEFEVAKKPTPESVENIFDRYNLRLLVPDGDVDYEDPNHFSGYFLRGAFGGTGYHNEYAPYVIGSYNEYPGKIWPETVTYENFFYTRGIGYAPALYLDLSKKDVYRLVELPSFDLNELDEITTIQDALQLVEKYLTAGNGSQLKNPEWLDEFTLFIESALQKAYPSIYNQLTDGATFTLDQSLLSSLAPNNEDNKELLYALLDKYNVKLARPVRFGLEINQPNLDNYQLLLSPNMMMTFDFVQINSQDIIIRFSDALLKSLEKPLRIDVQKKNKAPVSYDLELGSPIEHNLSIALKPVTKNHLYQAAIKDGVQAIGGKYNPGDGYVWFKSKTSGNYGIQERHKKFSDINHQSEAAQLAINVLAAKGIINGTSDTTFSPDSSISRAEIAALILKSISKLDPTAPMMFNDVEETDWYFTVAASAKKAGIMNGIDAVTFAPTQIIPKDQIVAVAARTLRSEMYYKEPHNSLSLIQPFKDYGAIQDWSKKDLGYAMTYGLIQMTDDNTFNPSLPMTRANAAIILYELFMKLW